MWTRRHFLATASLTAVCSACRCNPLEELEVPSGQRAGVAPVSEEVAQLALVMRETPLDELIARLATRVRSGLELPILAEAASLVALRYCQHVSSGKGGIVSHALLSVGAALRLSRVLAPERAAIPLLQTCYVVVRESHRSPYGPQRELPQLDALEPAGQLDRALEDAIRARDIERADRIAIHMIAAGEDRLVGRVVTTVAMESLGHLGHGLIMASQVADLRAAFAGRRPELLRAPVRYLASFHLDDSSAVRARSARQGQSAATTAGQVARAVESQHHSDAVCRNLTTATTDLLLRQRPSPSTTGAMHLLTATHAARRAVANNDVADPGLLVRVGSWLDMARAGETELGPMSFGEARSSEPRPGDIAGLASALREEKRAEIGQRVAHLARHEAQRTELLAFLAELATANARTTLQHSLKALDATIRESNQTQSTAGSDKHLILAAVLASRSITRVDPLYGQILKALDLPRHPEIRL